MDLAVCYQCGQLCENNLTYCHSCYDDRSKSDFQNEQRWRSAEDELQSLTVSLKRQLAATRQLQVTVSAFRTMLLQGIHADVTIETGDGDRTPAHRAVLASRSPVFNAMFEHELKEKTCAVIRVADVPTPAMRSLLLYLYAGEHDTKVMRDHGISVLAAAHKYDIQDLKRTCETSITVQPSNAVELLQQARLYDANLLKETCIDVIAKNIKELAHTDEFRHFILKNEEPEVVLDIFQSVADVL